MLKTIDKLKRYNKERRDLWLKETEKVNDLSGMVKALQSEIEMLVEKSQSLENIVNGQCDKAKKGNEMTTLTGTIDGFTCDVKGLCMRDGIGSKNPPGPCLICKAMLHHQTSDKLLLHGIICPYAGTNSKGHIYSYHPKLYDKLNDAKFL